MTGQDTAPRTAPPDWRGMTRGDFDTDAPAPPLFDLEPSAVAARDECGTGDLLELLSGGDDE